MKANVIRRPSLVRQETVNQSSGTSIQRCELPLNTAKPAASAPSSVYGPLSVSG